MASRDLHNNLHPRRGLSPVVASDNTAQVSQICDTAGFEGCELLVLAGQLADADATFTLLVEDGDAANLADAAPVVDEFLLGLESQAGLTFADDDRVRKIGYVGPKRYVRATLTPAGNTGSAPLAAVWVLGAPRHAPTTNPPA